MLGFSALNGPSHLVQYLYFLGEETWDLDRLCFSKRHTIIRGNTETRNLVFLILNQILKFSA